MAASEKTGGQKEVPENVLHGAQERFSMADMPTAGCLSDLLPAGLSRERGWGSRGAKTLCVAVKVIEPVG